VSDNKSKIDTFFKLVVKNFAND